MDILDDMGVSKLSAKVNYSFNKVIHLEGSYNDFTVKKANNHILETPQRIGYDIMI